MSRSISTLMVVSAFCSSAYAKEIFEECRVSGMGNMMNWISVVNGTQLVDGCPLFIKDISSVVMGQSDVSTIRYLDSTSTEICEYGRFLCVKLKSATR